METFICIPFEEKPQILFQAWEIFFAIKYSKPENPNELFQKLLEDLKELAEYKSSQSKDRPIFLNDNEEHSVQNEESLENSSTEIATSNSNKEKEEPLQDSDICKLIREKCCVEVSEEQKQNLIKSALNTKLLSINSQRLDKKEEEVKNVVEQSAEHGNRSIESLQNFRVIHKSSFSLKNSSQIYSIHAVAPILLTKEPKYSSSMGYENSKTTPETESDEIIKSGVEELVPILSENEVTLEDKRECDVPISENSPIYDDHSEIFSDSKNDDDISVYDDFKDIEYVEASLPDPEIVNGVEEENVVHQAEENDVEEEESLNDNPTPDCVLNSFESDNSLSDNFSPEFKTFCDHTEETRSGNTTTHADNSLSEYDSFCFKVEPDQERLINVMKNDIPDDSRRHPFLEELLIDDSILSHESSVSNFEDNPSVPLPPLEQPDAEFDAGEEIPVMMNDKDEDVDYSSFIFVMFAKVFSLLSTESEDTIFDPDIKYVEASLSDSEFVSLGEENDVYQKEKEIDFEDILQIQDVILCEKLLSINRLIADIEFLNDNPTPDRVLKTSSSSAIFAKTDNSLSYSDNSLPEFKIFSDHTEETRSGSTTAHVNNSPPVYDSFCFKIKPDQGRLTSIFMNDISDNSTNDPLLAEVDLFLVSNNLIPLGIKNFDYDSEGDIYFLKELLSNDSLPLFKNKSSNLDHHDDPSFPRPPSEPPDVEFFFDFEPNSGELISAVMNNIDELIEDECFDPGGVEIDVFAIIKDDDCFPYIFAIGIFLPYLIYPEVSPLLLSTRSEDTIFNLGISI
uniref:Reverse transcriptase domain-containing protein n=1 Tax=Tanacetum cinerariifolium TaxID=118510 RepID=A0A6L2LXF3_TANCI|nr:hypothetical protein [Tanacetum cinerariifolium]